MSKDIQVKYSNGEIMNESRVTLQVDDVPEKIFERFINGRRVYYQVEPSGTTAVQIFPNEDSIKSLEEDKS